MIKIPDQVAREHTWIAFESHFENREAFDEFLESIAISEDKEKFLRVGSIYLCLVKRGDWVVNIPESDQVVDYFTESYKLVTICSLIELIYTERYQTFFDWLNSRKKKCEFPLDRKRLQSLFKEYNQEFGSNKNCVKFFGSLPCKLQSQLCKSIRFHDTETTIETFSSHLYNLRSQFVHRGEVVTSLGSGVLLDLDAIPFVTTSLSFSKLQMVFEYGVVDFFRKL